MSNKNSSDSSVRFPWDKHLHSLSNFTCSSKSLLKSSFSRLHCRWAAARLRVASAAARPRLIGHSFIVSGAGLIASVQFVCAAASGGGADSPQREVLEQQVGLRPDTCDRPFCLTESKGVRMKDGVGCPPLPMDSHATRLNDPASLN